MDHTLFWHYDCNSLLFCLAVVLLLTFQIRPGLNSSQEIDFYSIEPIYQPIYQPQTATQFLVIELDCCVICSNLQFQAEEHSEEDKAETEQADGQADQPSEQSSLPGRVVELLTARYGTAALHSLQSQQRKREQETRESVREFFLHDCNLLPWKMDWKCSCKMCSIITICLPDCKLYVFAVVCQVIVKKTSGITNENTNLYFKVVCLVLS